MNSDTVVLDHFNSTTVAAYTPGVLAYNGGPEGLHEAAHFGTGQYAQYRLEGMGSEGTIEMWVNLSRYDSRIMDINWNNVHSDPPSGHIFHLWVNETGHLQIGGWSDYPGGVWPASTGAIPLNQWTHIAYTWGPTGSRIYINGQVDMSDAIDWSPSFSGSNYAYLNYWGGKDLGDVDELRISRVAHTRFDTLISPSFATEYTLLPETAVLDHFNSTTVAAYTPGALTYTAGPSGLHEAAHFGTGQFARYRLDGMGSEGTIEMWVNLSQYDARILDINWNNVNSDPPSGHIFHLWVNETGHLQIGGWSDYPGGVWPASTGAIPLNQWTHIAYTWGPAGSRIYINGQVDMSDTVDWSPSFSGRDYAYLNYWGGMDLGDVDELRIARVAYTKFDTLSSLLPSTPPHALFTTDVTGGSAPLTVHFTDTSTGNPTTWRWEFGDGANETVQHPVHTFTVAGTYPVRLTAINSAGSDSTTVLITAVADSNSTLPYQFVGQFGGHGSGAGKLEYPRGIAVDRLGNVYVADTDNKRIQKFSPNGTFLIQWGSFGSGNGQVSTPFGITVDGEDDVYVADTYNHRIQKFTSSGVFLAKWGGQGVGDGQFSYPCDVAVDSEGNVYVLDSGNRRVEKFTSSGTFVTKWGNSGGADGQFNTPYGIEVDGSGNVYVADWDNNRIQKFTSSGTFITKWGTYGGDQGQLWGPYGIAVDSAGDVYISEFYQNRMQKFTPSGTSLTAWGNGGSGDGQLNKPCGVAVGPNGNVYVADCDNHRIQVFNQDGVPLVTPISPPQASFRADVTGGRAPLTVHFTDTSTGNPTAWRWEFGDGTSTDEQNPDHVYTAAGTYTVNLTVSNADGVDTVSTTITVSTETLPVASFAVNVTGGRAPLTVHFTDTSTGNPTAWRWEFGDDISTDEQNPDHVYTAAGTYTVNLTVSNADGLDTVSTIITVSTETMPVANFTTNATAGQTPFTVQFTDQSTSGADGYQWQFGDGATSTEQNPIHTYTSSGSYTVMLTISVPDYGSVFAQKPGYITVTTQPSAAFSANVTAGLAPLAVQFTEAANSSVLYSFWHFGDGATSAEQNPVHVYDSPGNYSVSLLTVGLNGYEVKTVENYINVTPTVTPTVTTTTTTTVTPTPTEALPTANFTITPGAPGSSDITVTDSSTNATSVRYDLGDGTTTAYPNFRYFYWQPGTYTIELTATNAAGSTKKSLSITVPITAPTTSVTPTTTTVAPTVTGNPYNGPHTIPGTLQAEDYDLGGEGVAYHDTSAGNEGGIYRHDDVDIEQLDTDGSPNVGWSRTGEWLMYTVNVTSAGTYTAGFRVASSHSGSSVQIYLDDGTTPVATVSVPNSGNNAAFMTVAAPVTLPAGQHQLRLSFPGNYANINWVTFT